MVHAAVALQNGISVKLTDQDDRFCYISPNKLLNQFQSFLDSLRYSTFLFDLPTYFNSGGKSLVCQQKHHGWQVMQDTESKPQ